MSLEERATEFIDRMGINRDNVSDVHFVEFADEAVKAERERIASDLWFLTRKLPPAKIQKIENYIAQLRNGETK